MIYEQSTGKLYSDIRHLFGIGYSGYGEGKNNPSMENIKMTGPLPKGKYIVGKPYDSSHTGPFTLPLTPFEDNNMYGRSDFKIHGDSISAPGTASNGCIILPRSVRVLINNCTDKILEVV
jgi:hypothetical protein